MEQIRSGDEACLSRAKKVYILLNESRMVATCLLHAGGARITAIQSALGKAWRGIRVFLHDHVASRVSGKMPRITVVLALAAVYSCQSTPPKLSKQQPDVDLRPVKVGKLWGYADDSGAMRIAPRFNRAEEFSDGRAMVETKHGWGLRFIDARGEYATGEQFYEWAAPFSEGLAPARVALETYGYIDKRGRWLAEPQYAGARGFREDLAPVRVKVGGLWGYVDRQFRDAIPARFRDAGEFHEGLAAVKDQESGRTGFIDRAGVWVIPARWAEARHFSEDGLAPAQLWSDGDWGFVNRAGRMVLAARYEEARSFHEGHAAVRLRGKWGMIDTSGNLAIKPRFDLLLPMQRGWAQARIGDDAMGYVNAKEERLLWFEAEL